MVVFTAHEILHAVCFPDKGRTNKTYICAWPVKLAFYTHFDGEISRNRFIITLITPFLVLTLGPILIYFVLSWAPAFVISLSVINGMSASVDLFGAALVGLQLPSSSILRNKGYKSWWRDVM